MVNIMLCIFYHNKRKFLKRVKTTSSTCQYFMRWFLSGKFFLRRPPNPRPYPALLFFFFFWILTFLSHSRSVLRPLHSSVQRTGQRESGYTLCRYRLCGIKLKTRTAFPIDCLRKQDKVMTKS